MRYKALLLASALGIALASSCASVDAIPYFQDLDAASLDTITSVSSITIKPDDKISIIVNCRDNELSNLFNLPYSARTIGQPSEYNSSYSQGISGYLVDSEGNIDFPVLGTLHIAGMTRAEISKYIKKQLIDNNLVKDPIVTVDYVNLHVSVMGEVTRPGRFNIDKDQYTIFDALSAAGDLTIFGRRENVKVLRTEGGAKKTYMLNLCSGKEVISSPVYYLQQGDIIYVEPNEMRMRQSTVNGNNLVSTSFWISVASLATTISYYFFKP
ncbi:MAG: polysaccharide export protein [Bacteroidales bacterium]|nr:polysaccharide export protein [Bacteroidales bacterium]MDY3782947.1 polysaccharide biosynthesis/export family protein [Candidatus Cryptobacteroides sp.]